MKILSLVLDNGLTVFMVPMDGTKKLSAMFTVKAGFRYETKRNVGVSHFIEHMAFKGTGRRPTPIDIAREADNIGGTINASTDVDLISYFLTVPARHAEVACDLLGDIVANPSLNPAEIELAKGPISEEVMGYRIDSWTKMDLIVLPALLFPDKPAGRFVSAADIEKIDAATLRAYMQKHFFGANAVLCFAGQIPNPAAFFEIIKCPFGVFPAGKSNQSAMEFNVTNGQKDIRLRLLRAKPNDPFLVLMKIKAYTINHPNKWIIYVLNAILGGSLSSRLFSELRERRGLSYYAQSQFEYKAGFGILSITADLDPKRWKEGLEIISSQLSLLRDMPVSAEELSRAKEMLWSATEMRLEEPEFVAESIAFEWGLTGKVREFTRIRQGIKSVTASDIQLAAQELFCKDNICLAITGPKRNEKEEIINVFSNL